MDSSGCFYTYAILAYRTQDEPPIWRNAGVITAALVSPDRVEYDLVFRPRLPNATELDPNTYAYFLNDINARLHQRMESSINVGTSAEEYALARLVPFEGRLALITCGGGWYTSPEEATEQLLVQYVDNYLESYTD